MEKYTLPPLPYGYDALEPYISKEIMMLHHDKHHAGYVSNLNAAIEKHPDLFSKSAEDLLINLNDVPEDIRVAVRNNAGGHVNHSMFWQIMAPNGGGEPSGKLAEEINKHFGSFSEFQEKFNDAGAKRFGSGWVWLVKTKEGKLDIISTANQDNPMTDGHFPIMGNDVWEHAYYLQYKNVRADYLKAWWNVVNWEEVSKRI
ncbi:MAG: superoxide dismutase [Candidatus Staskawiczbacteria bacterium RIFCSPLOWO2_01_FULL_40_39]|uniref:Superoxide dismutase n=1 Tax=Candidatus Staskawiczbacteria bacterium RIFCSPHIGHO2_01_FULL_39_25 TaxID=1802202 RepID=A0A1G2HNU6_9BACT|nr:MAG: superoxide dismutase [Candidatus Staskawiczbacteria bacterium RIFCSPHIGHO2_01_FULL_39_25]OGZ73983.1 MAG: superoxide dismutase [Candidatus Staskawiczbacteria bacterium RIFCSPLOWO2_01_FULL_40_39]OGZ76431.1 MAG: superoxide dismutase [Candidatus Staskawiczbacteria bacterium RIFCSPLOWO2_02_FULL_39_8]